MSKTGMMNLNLSHKGLILVSTPLAINLIFVGTLAALLNQAEYEIWKESHAKAVIAKTEEIVNLLHGGVVATISYAISRNPAAAQRIDSIVAQEPEEMRSLQLLYKDNPNAQADLSNVIASSDRAVELLRDYKVHLDEGEPALFRESEILAQADKSFEQLTQGLNSLTKIERTIASQPPEAEARSRLLVKYALYAGVALNIFMALLLGRWFSKWITSRISIMTSNTQHLSKGEPLNQPLSGNDEISQLDHTFHQMADRLTEVDRLKRELAMITHDLRSPLTAISGALAMMARGIYGELSEKNQEICGRAQRGAVRLQSLINDLLDIEKLESGKWELVLGTVSVPELFQQSLESVENLAQQGQVKLVSQPAQVELCADQKRLAQVIVNLLSNAINFSPSNSTVTLKAETIPGWVEIRVSAQGRGIPKDDLEKVFNRFERVKATDATIKGGTGLRLAVCKGIIEEHKGAIGLESEEGKGATFWFRIPYSGNGCGAEQAQ